MEPGHGHARDETIGHRGQMNGGLFAMIWVSRHDRARQFETIGTELSGSTYIRGDQAREAGTLPPTPRGGEKFSSKQSIFTIAPLQTGQARPGESSNAFTLCRYTSLALGKDSPAAAPESLRGCPWRKMPKCWRATTRTPFNFLLCISRDPWWGPVRSYG